jgi:Protein of unknown function (DUF3750)
MRMVTLFILLTLIGPLYLIGSRQINFFGDYRTANRDSAHLAPLPEASPEAIVQIYSARAFNWNGLFSVHTWIATKAKVGKSYTVYQVVGWRKFRGLSPMLVEESIPDRNWFAQTPKIIYETSGESAAKLIPLISQAAKDYPHPKEYRLWPGPNSNTFTASVLRAIPELHVAMPANAVGKDFLSGWKIFAPAVSHTGYQFSLYGVFSLTLAREEGLEINLFGLVYGINPFKLSLKLPCIGEITIPH